MTARERVTYFNGKIVPESQAMLSYRDRAFRYGDGVFDMTRTFGGHIFKLKEHIDRLYASLKYVRIDPGLSPAEMINITEQVVAQNRPLLGPFDDFWVGQRISRGPDVPSGEIWESGQPTVIVDCTPLPLKPRAKLFRDGIDVDFSSIRRVPPESLSPNVKSLNYLNLVLADQEIRTRKPDAWAILLDTRGFLAEGIGSNLFLVKDGTLFTPKREYVLAGVSRQTVIELAEAKQIPVIEADLSPYDAYAADEAFITSTSFCLCPVRAFNDQEVGPVPGPITQALTEAYSDLVDFDFVEQYLHYLEPSDG